MTGRPEVDERTRALEEIAGIARRHGLTAGEISTALDLAPAVESRGRAVLVRVLGFLGGTFVFAGVGVFIALQWDAMNAASRVIVTLGSGVAAFVMALAAHQDRRFEVAATPLFLMAAALQPVGMLVAFEEYGSGGDWRLAGLAASGAMVVQHGLAFVPVRRATVLFLCVLFGVLFAWTVFDLLDVDGTLVALTLGGSMLLLAVGVDRTRHRAIAPPWYFCGASAFLGGLFDAVDGTLFEPAFLGAASGFVYLSVAVRSRTLLFVATLGILAYTGWFTAQNFADSVGWPLALVAFGLVMIGLSAVALRIDRRYVRR